MGAFINSASPGLGLSIGAVGAGLLVQSVASPDRLGVRRAHRRLRAGRRRRAAAAGELAPAARRAWRRCARGCTCPPPTAAPSSSRCRCCVACWAIGGLYASLGPSLVADVFGIDNHLVGGLLILALNGTGILGSLALRTAPPERAMLVGALVFTVGVVGTLVALFATSAPLLFAAAVVTGFGFGAAFLGAVATITARASPRVTGPACWPASSSSATWRSASRRSPRASPPGDVGLTRTTEVYGAAVVVLALLAVAGLLRARRTAGSLAAAGSGGRRDDRLRPAQLPG